MIYTHELHTYVWAKFICVCVCVCIYSIDLLCQMPSLQHTCKSILHRSLKIVEHWDRLHTRQKFVTWIIFVMMIAIRLVRISDLTHARSKTVIRIRILERRRYVILGDLSIRNIRSSACMRRAYYLRKCLKGHVSSAPQNMFWRSSITHAKFAP